MTSCVVLHAAAMVLMAADTLLLMDFTEVLQLSRAPAVAADTHTATRIDIDWANASPEPCLYQQSSDEHQEQECDVPCLRGIVRVNNVRKHVTTETGESAAAALTVRCFDCAGFLC